MITETELKIAIEVYIDTHGLTGLGNMIGDIFNEKANHIRDNWQDEPLALRWERASWLTTGNFARLKKEVYDE